MRGVFPEFTAPRNSRTWNHAPRRSVSGKASPQEKTEQLFRSVLFGTA